MSPSARMTNDDFPLSSRQCRQQPFYLLLTRFCASSTRLAGKLGRVCAQALAHSCYCSVSLPEVRDEVCIFIFSYLRVLKYVSYCSALL
jgi:hypothetical protein